MQVIDTAIDAVKVIEPRVFGDNRGFFYGNLSRRLV
jgi:dTDP-4-dehydrorhamnose 3,5-epimerase-like enzyme